MRAARLWDRRRASRRSLDDLLASAGALLALTAAACAPQDIYLFERGEQAVNTAPDAGREPVSPEPASPGPTSPEPPPPDSGAPATVEQPVCESAACEDCLERGACAASTEPLCHPESGECVAGCDARAADAPGSCPGVERCEARGVCVECLTRSDCAAPTPACDEPLGSCVECLADLDCDPRSPVCVESERRCVECESDADCRLRVAADDDDDELRCSPARQCVECLSDADCAEIEPDKPFCSSELECEDERE